MAILTATASMLNTVQQAGSPTPAAASGRKARRWSQVMALLPVYLLQICYGMNTGYPAVLTPQLREQCSELPITEDQESWIVSIENLATPLVCVLSGFLQPQLGPLKVLMLACIPYSVGWVSAAMASTVHLLYLSRILVGVSHGILTTTVYTVEVASIDMRGTYSVLESVLRCVGCLVIYSLGYAFRWNVIASFAPIVPMLALFTCMLAPESPVYLLSKHKTRQAILAMHKLYGPQYNVAEEVQIIHENLRALQKSRKHSYSTYLRDIKDHPEVYKPFMIMMLLSLVQQFSGMSVLRAYVIKIFSEVFSSRGLLSHSSEFGSSNASVSNCTPVEHETTSISSEAYVSAIIIGLVRLMASLLLSKLVRNFRRRFMYFLSAFLTMASLISFATCNYLIMIVSSEEPGAGHVMQPLQWASLITACMLVFSVQLGIQTLPSLLSGELFNSDVRPFCKGLTRGLACVYLVFGLKLYPVLESCLAIYGTFFMYSLVLGLSVPVVYYLLPETKDMGLEMIQSYFTPPKTVFYVDLELEQAAALCHVSGADAKGPLIYDA